MQGSSTVYFSFFQRAPGIKLWRPLFQSQQCSIFCPHAVPSLGGGGPVESRMRGGAKSRRESSFPSSFSTSPQCLSPQGSNSNTPEPTFFGPPSHFFLLHVNPNLQQLQFCLLVYYLSSSSRHFNVNFRVRDLLFFFPVESPLSSTAPRTWKALHECSRALRLTAGLNG